jgi:xylulokinase
MERRRRVALLGLDIGTSGCKAGVFDVEGRLRAFARGDYRLHTPRAGLLEMDVGEVKRALLESVSAVCGQYEGESIEAVGISSLGDVVVAVDRYGRPTHNAILDIDPRGQEEIAHLVEILGAERIYELTGMPAAWVYGICKIMWLWRNVATVRRETTRFLCLDGLAMLWLGAQAAIEHSMASRTMAFDISRREWAPAILEAADLDPGLLPPPCPPGTIVGGVGKSIASQTGLRASTPVVAGAHDWVCAVAATGVRPGSRQVTDIMGSLEGILVCTRTPFLQPEARERGFSTYCGPDENAYVTMGFVPTAGVLLEWSMNNLVRGATESAAVDKQDAFDAMITAATRKPSTVIVTPHFAGMGTPGFDPHARGVMSGLGLDTGRAEIVRGILDGLAYELRLNIEGLEELGFSVEEICCVGGGAKSDAWLQLKADITGKRVQAPRIVEASCTGAAILGGVGVGRFETTEQAATAWSAERRVFAPDSQKYAAHQEPYAKYIRIRDALGGVSL